MSSGGGSVAAMGGGPAWISMVRYRCVARTSLFMLQSVSASDPVRLFATHQRSWIRPPFVASDEAAPGTGKRCAGMALAHHGRVSTVEIGPWLGGQDCASCSFMASPSRAAQRLGSSRPQQPPIRGPVLMPRTMRIPMELLAQHRNSHSSLSLVRRRHIDLGRTRSAAC